MKKVFDEKLKMLELNGAVLVPIVVSDMMNIGAAHFMTFVTEIIPSVKDHFENQENIGLGKARIICQIIAMFRCNGILSSLC